MVRDLYFLCIAQVVHEVCSCRVRDWVLGILNNLIYNWVVLGQSVCLRTNHASHFIHVIIRPWWLHYSLWRIVIQNTWVNLMLRNHFVLNLPWVIVVLVELWLLVFLHQKVVSCSDVAVLIALKLFSSILWVNLKVWELCKDLLIDLYVLRITDIDAWLRLGIWGWVLLVPIMVSNLINCETFVWISVEDFM